jgi:isoaspartyl peptidase/L-asparaginase-like protein (Ntn-hydrolase superfamily)
VVGVAIISFTLGYLAGVDRGRVGECALLAHPTWATTTPVVASRAGTAYYFLSCAGAGKIASGNRVLFPSPEAAESTGYTLAASCRP